MLRVSDDLIRHLAKTISEPQATHKSSATFYSVIASSLNIRSGPGKKYDKTGILHSSDQILLVDHTNSTPWLKIKTPDGQEGFVHEKYVRAVTVSTAM